MARRRAAHLDALPVAVRAAVQPAARRAPRRSKYHAIPAVYNGRRYDSTGEAEYAALLDLRVRAGQIAGWRNGRRRVLLVDPSRRVKISYIPDFEVWTRPDESDLWVVDFKGVLTPVFRLKAQLWRCAYPHIPLWIARADGTEERLWPLPERPSRKRRS